MVLIIGQIKFVVDIIVVGVSEIVEGNSDLLVCIEQQVVLLEEIVVLMKGFIVIVQCIVDNVCQVSVFVSGVVDVVDQGGYVVYEVVVMMVLINDFLWCIVDIIGVIDGIVFQINILVFNVVVEVVCVGEYGCGFVVVVLEICLLLQCLADVVKEIK